MGGSIHPSGSQNSGARGLNSLMLLCISIIAFILSIPIVGIYPLGLVSYLPFFLVILKGKNIIWNCCVFGAGIYGATFYYIVFINDYYFNLLKNLSLYLLIILLGILEFLIFGLFYKNVIQKTDNRIKALLMSSIYFGIFEFLCDKANLGFHLYMGISQNNNRLLMPLARYIGIYGISVLVVLINLILAHLMLVLLQKESSKELLRYSAALAAITILIGISHAVPKIQSGSEEKIKACIIQGNITSEEYYEIHDQPTVGQSAFSKYINMTLESIERHKPEIVVWPEGTVNLWVMRLEPYRNALLELAKDHKVYLLLAFPDLDSASNEYNSAFVISPEGKIAGRYDKSILVPFKESCFVKGIDNMPLKLANTRLGVQLCYEAVFPQLSSRDVRHGADVLVFLSNNIDFGHTNEPFLMTALASFRASESGRAVIQAMNNGPSGLILSDGKVQYMSDFYKEETVLIDVPLSNKELTFFTRYGELFYISLTLIIVFLSIKKYVCRINILAFLHGKRKVR